MSYFNLKKVVFIFLVVFIFFYPKEVRASNGIINEEFNGGWSEINKWNILEGPGLFSFFDPDFVTVSAPDGPKFVYAYTKDNFPNKDIDIKIRFRFQQSNLNYGAGIILSDGAPTNWVDHDPNPYTIIKIWPLAGGTSFRLTSNICPEILPNCTQRTFIKDISGEGFEAWHVLEIKFVNSKYLVYLDSEELFVSSQTIRIPKQIFLGTPELVGHVMWPLFQIDYIRVNALEEEKNPVILVPGFGASWDTGAILTNSEGNNWIVPPFVKVYDNLLNSLEANGYVRGENLFVFPYDWRKDIRTLDDELDSFIGNLITTGKILESDKIDFIGHSMGGLVVRSYAQNIDKTKVDKIITAGSPNLGAVDAYGVWAGGVAWERPWWQNLALGLLVQLNRSPGERKTDVIRSSLPSLKNLIPVYNFLSSNGSLRNWPSLYHINNLLPDLNDESVPIDTFLRAIKGVGSETRKVVRVQDRTWLDELMHRWEDGRPISGVTFETADGDGTVTQDSAVGPFSQWSSVSGNHLGLVSSSVGIEEILKQLGIVSPSIVTDTAVNVDTQVLAIKIASPGKLRVCNLANVCDSNLGYYDEADKLFFAPSYNGDKLLVDVMPDGNAGAYKLHLGVLGSVDGAVEPDNWDVFSGYMTPTSEVDRYELSLDNGRLVSNKYEDLSQSTRRDIMLRWRMLNRIRAMLSRQIRVAYRQGGEYEEGINSVLEQWGEIDSVAENLSHKIRPKKSRFSVLRKIRFTKRFMKRSERTLSRSDNVFVGILYERAERLVGEAELIRTSNPTGAYDKLSSARWLIITALRII